MSTATYLRSRVDREPVTFVLALGDLLAILAFTTVGAMNHGSPLARLPGITAPFVLGWVLAALVGGLYTLDAIATPRRAVSWAVPAWIVAVLVGMGLRATDPFPGTADPAFLLVTLGIGGTLVVGWRLLASLILHRR